MPLMIGNRESQAMPTEPKDQRASAERRFQNTQKTNQTARFIIDEEQAATRKKTDRLKALRLAKEAREDAPEKKPSVRKQPKRT
jgi:hypothetical protein